MDGLLLGASAAGYINGIGVLVLGSLVFFGSAYVLLSAVFGRWMGYLVTAVSFFGMMIIFSLIFVFGVPGSTPPNLGPRGTRYGCPTCISEPHWAPVAFGERISSREFDSVAKYPGGPWEAPDDQTRSEVESLTSSIREFMAHEAAGTGAQASEGTGGAVGSEDVTGGEGAPEEEGRVQEEISPTDFTVQSVRFTQEDDTRLAAAEVFFNDGGPLLRIFAVFDEGNVPLPSYIFLGVSLLGFLAHLPFLDKAERKRKDILTGGTAPKFLGPA